jgi:hypothetical protein
MSTGWPSLSYTDWEPCCDTLHALTQLLGKLAVALGVPEPQLQHAALRLTARGWETSPLPAPDASGSLVVALDLRHHQALIEHSGGETRHVDLPSRAVAEITQDVLGAIQSLAGAVTINPTPQEVPWDVALTEDREHHAYDPAGVETYFTAATRAALVLAEFRAPFRGRVTPVNAWWGSFDLAVNLFSGAPADPPSDDFIMRNAMDSQEVAIGWWPGDPNYPRAAFYAYAYPAATGFAEAQLDPAAARWNPALGEFVLDWADVIMQDDPHQVALRFAHSVFAHACAVCRWPDALAATITGGS